ncbi:MAG: pyridoxamine 5'-phosphate oxidase family protein [Firmicutes bacterium]|nr:pyridoxamine 5'-phosphate oxidase family protein [Bacillota bacterium]
MFRQMRRIKQQISVEECEKVLFNEPRGVLAVLGDDDYPYTVPLDFIYSDGKIYFHGAGEGHKMDAIRRHDKVSFCVMDGGFRREGEWALNINSVIVFGCIKEVTDINVKIEKVRLLGLKYNPDPQDVEDELKRYLDIEKHIDRVTVLELTPEHITGKLVNES